MFSEPQALTQAAIRQIAAAPKDNLFMIMISNSLIRRVSNRLMALGERNPWSCHSIDGQRGAPPAPRLGAIPQYKLRTGDFRRRSTSIELIRICTCSADETFVICLLSKRARLITTDARYVRLSDMSRGGGCRHVNFRHPLAARRAVRIALPSLFARGSPLSRTEWLALVLHARASSST